MTVTGINGPSASASPYFMSRLYSGSDADQDGELDFWESAFQDRYTVQYDEQLQNVQLSNDCCPITACPRVADVHDGGCPLASRVRPTNLCRAMRIGTNYSESLVFHTVEGLVLTKTTEGSDATCSDVILELWSSADSGFPESAACWWDQWCQSDPGLYLRFHAGNGLRSLTDYEIVFLASLTTAINDHLQTVKVDVFDADGARLNEGWGDVTKTILTESVPGGDLQSVVMDFEIVNGDPVQEDLSFVLRAGSASANVIGASYEVCVPVPAHVVAGWHHVLLQQVRRQPGGVQCEENGPQHEHPVPRDGPERCRHWLRHDGCVHCHWTADPFRRLLSSGVWR